MTKLILLTRNKSTVIQTLTIVCFVEYSNISQILTRKTLILFCILLKEKISVYYMKTLHEDLFKIYVDNNKG